MVQKHDSSKWSVLTRLKHLSCGSAQTVETKLDTENIKNRGVRTCRKWKGDRQGCSYVRTRKEAAILSEEYQELFETWKLKSAHFSFHFSWKVVGDGFGQKTAVSYVTAQNLGTHQSPFTAPRSYQRIKILYLERTTSSLVRLQHSSGHLLHARTEL